MEKKNIFNPNLIICPIDFSELSSLALKYAAIGARKFNAKLVVCHVKHFETPRYMMKNIHNSIISQLRETKKHVVTEIRNHTEKILDTLVRKLQIEYEVLDAHPVEAILSLAEKESAGLIVMGTHGCCGMKNFLQGSVTESILRMANIPVFIVKQKENDFIDVNQIDAVPDLKRILCPCSLTDSAVPSLQIAGSMAQHFHARLSVLYNVETEQTEGSFERDKEKLRSWIAKNMDIKCDIEPIIRKGNAAEQIIFQAKDGKEDIIIIGANYKPFLKKTYIGRTTELVLRQAPVPVFTVPDF